MSRTTRVPTPEAQTTREEVDARVSETNATLDRARAELTAARTVFVDVEKAWLDRGGKALAEKKREAEDEVQRRTILEERAEMAHTEALAAQAQVERRERTAGYEAAKAKLGELPGAIDATAARIIEMERALDTLVLEVVAAVDAADGTYAEAEALAGDLGLEEDLARNVVRLTIPQSRERVKRALHAQRATDGRGPVDQWLATPPTHWRDATGVVMSPEERSATEQWAAANADAHARGFAINRDRQLAHLAAEQAREDERQRIRQQTSQPPQETSQ